MSLPHLALSLWISSSYRVPHDPGPANVSPETRHPTQLAASCISIWNELRLWLLWNLWLYLSLRVARICTGQRREKRKNLDIRPRDSPPRGQCSEFHDGRITQKLSQYDIAYYWLHCHGDWKTSTHREKTDYLIHCIIRVILWVSLKVEARLMNLKLMRAQFRTQQESVFVNFIFWLGTGKQASQLRLMQVLKTNWKLFRMSNIQQALFYLF